MSRFAKFGDSGEVVAQRVSTSLGEIAIVLKELPLARSMISSVPMRRDRREIQIYNSLQIYSSLAREWLYRLNERT